MQITRTPAVKLVDVTRATQSLSTLLADKRAHDDDKRLVTALGDLLEKMLVFDPAKRITVREAIRHPFIRGK
ncbi:hypothetical protein EON66_02140 [archaeon]|nr:MAG: hypothetical protein EON66_02140 [archaeon]